LRFDQSSVFFSLAHWQALQRPCESKVMRGRVDIFRQLEHQNKLFTIAIT